LFLVLATVTGWTAPEPPSASLPVSFSKDLAPIFLQKCVTCHGPEKSKGGYQLHTFEGLWKGGESKEPPVIPGQPERSKLFQLLVAKDPDDRMPQKDDPLPAAQIALIERWIKDGAKFDGPDPKATLASMAPALPHPDPPAAYARPVPILALAFSPDGTELAASGQHEVTFWNPTSGALLRRVKNLPQQIHALAFSPDGALVAACGGTPGRSGELNVFDPRSSVAPKPLAVAPDCVLALAFSPDGRRLIGGGADNAIRVFDIATGREERRIEQHADWVLGLAFSPDGARFASASRDKTARLFDVSTGELEETYAGHAAAVFAVAFGGDGKSVFTAGRDREVHAWQTNDAKKIFEIRGFEGDVLRIHLQGDQLFSCCTDRQIREHRLGEKKAELVRTFGSHHDVVYALAHHEPTHRLATGSFDGEVRVWDTGDGKPVNHFIAAPGVAK
jgi:dipeptidyl aminopeptidase/acylaminoacyl peptidase/mono/diheme cytochrome c family protein